MMILKITKDKALHSLQPVYFSEYILRVKAWNFFFFFFLNETSILVFVELAIFHHIYIRTSFGKIVGKITR